MSDLYRPPIADDPTNTPLGKRAPWRGLAVCMAVAWVIVLTRVAMGRSGWEL